MIIIANNKVNLWQAVSSLLFDLPRKSHGLGMTPVMELQGDSVQSR